MNEWMNVCVGMIRFVDRCVIRNSMNRIRFGRIYRYAEVMALSIQQDGALTFQTEEEKERIIQNGRARVEKN